MRVTTRAQRLAMRRLYLRDLDTAASNVKYGGDGVPSYPNYLAFRRRCLSAFDGCMMVPLWRMWIGIERDGYTHS